MTRANRFAPLAPPEEPKRLPMVAMFTIMAAVFSAGFCVGVLV